MLDQWKTWIADFDQCVADDQWDRLAPHLADDVIYCVQGAPFSCELRGRDAVIAGFARSIRGFDKAFDERRWFGVGVRFHPPGMITGRAMGWYRLGDRPAITFSAASQWIYRDGLLSVMTDLYDVAEADVLATQSAMDNLGIPIDPSYC